MKKRFILLTLFALLLITQSAKAKPVDAARAGRIATNYIRVTGMKINLDSTLLTDITSATPFTEFYVFACQYQPGFVLVSADDCVIPILGASDNSIFAAENIPEHILSWLQGYEEQISLCRQNGIAPSPDIERMWRTLDSDTPNIAPLTTTVSSVEPLLATTWDQTPYYNALCPGYGTANESVTGCVATATAQVMKYWNHPVTGFGSHSYSCPTYSDPLSANFGSTTYDWANMPNSLGPSSSATEVIAVATLMYHVGVAFDMQYGPSSGATTTMAVDVLQQYFKYKNNIRAVAESNYTPHEWKTLLRNELSATPGRPIIYSGQSSNSGHAFVFDGYNTTDQFHINWGWSGMFNGYFSIGALNPGIGGTGSNSVGQYNERCKAIISIEPNYSFGTGTTTTLTAVPDDLSHGSVTQSGSGTYNNYTDITLTATANPGYRFTQWSDGSNQNPRTFIAPGGNIDLTAIYDNFSGPRKQFFNPSTDVYSFTIPHWGIRLPASALADYDILQSVDFYVQTPGTYTVDIYNTNSINLTTPSASCSITVSSDQAQQWVTATLSEPLVLDQTKCLFLTINSTTSVSAPFVMNSWSGNTDGLWFALESNWYIVNNGEVPGDFLIRGNFTNSQTPTVTDISIANVTSSGATISWSTPAGATPTGYTIAYGTGLEPEDMPTISSATNSVQLMGLSPFTQYHVFVRADYGTAYSQWADAQFFTLMGTSDDEYVTITAQSANTNMGIVIGGGTYPNGTTISLEAIPLVGHRFVAWSDGNTDSLRTIQATDNATLTATFERNYYNFTATCIGSGYVSVIYTEERVNNKYPFGCELFITATPGSGYHFSHWGDGVTNDTRIITINRDVSVTAVFEPNSSKSIELNTSGREIIVSTSEPVPVQVYDMMGRCIFSTNATLQQSTRVPVSSAGVYLVKIDNSTTEKVIIR